MQTAQVLKVQVHTDITDSKMKIDQGQQVVMDLVETYFGSWRGVTVDNFLTSGALAEELFKKGIKIKDKMHANKREIPQEFLLHSKSKEY
jgi:hypothetical protein